MSILANKDTRVVIQGGAAGLNAARRMAEFCYMIKRPLNVEAFVYPPDAGKTNEVPYGNGLVTIPVYKVWRTPPRIIRRPTPASSTSAPTGPARPAWRR